MALQQFHSQQRSILGPLVGAFVRLLGLVAGKPLSREQRADLVSVLTDTANTARHEAVTLAFGLYLAVRPTDAAPIGEPTITDLPLEYFEKVLSSHIEALESEDHAHAGVTRVTQAAIRSVEGASRETIQAAVRYDPEAVGWARVLTGAESCGWCAMLASRGPIYNTARSAGQSDDWHLGCDCLVVPVFKGYETEWEGYDEYQKLENFWINATKGTSGKGSLKAFDRAFQKEDSTRYSPITRA